MTIDFGVLLERVLSAWYVAAPGTTTRVTCARPFAMRTILATATTTLACVAPELTKGLDGPIPEQSDILSALVLDGKKRWQKAVADRVLVELEDFSPNAHDWFV